jgi:membrane carboxypeptidase/penicillin-binding protein PbpC
MGISSDISSDKCGLSLVLGGCEITLLDHTAAMGVFANMGTKHEVAGILRSRIPKEKFWKSGKRIPAPRLSIRKLPTKS